MYCISIFVWSQISPLWPQIDLYWLTCKKLTQKWSKRTSLILSFYLMYYMPIFVDMKFDLKLTLIDLKMQIWEWDPPQPNTTLHNEYILRGHRALTFHTFCFWLISKFCWLTFDLFSVIIQNIDSKTIKTYSSHLKL